MEAASENPATIRVEDSGKRDQPIWSTSGVEDPFHFLLEWVSKDSECILREHGLL